MQTRKTSLLARLFGGLSMAALVLAISFGSSHAVRADNPELLTPSLQDMVIAPFMKAVAGIEERLTNLEAGIGAWADSFTARRIVVRELCFADDSGAQTCVTKGQLDALLRNVAQADGNPPAVTVTEAVQAPVTEAEAVDAPVTTAEAVESPVAAEDAAEAPVTTADAAEAPVTAADAAEAPAITAEAAEAPVATAEAADAAVSDEPAAITVMEANSPAAEPIAIVVTTDPTAPTAVPAEDAQADQASEHTGTVSAASSGAALVSSPDVEISIAAEATSGE